MGTEIPCSSVLTGLTIAEDIIPGKRTTLIKFPIYQCDSDCENLPTCCNYEVGLLEIYSDDIPFPLQRNSQFDITIKVDRNEEISFEIYFPEINWTIEKRMGIIYNQLIEVQTLNAILSLLIKNKLSILQQSHVFNINLDLPKHPENREPQFYLYDLQRYLGKLEKIYVEDAQQSLKNREQIGIEFFIDDNDNSSQIWLPFRMVASNMKNIKMRLIRHDFKWISDVANLNELGDIIKIEKCDSKNNYFHVFCLNERDEIVNSYPSVIKL